ncbi:MAG: hypothetical protein AABX65_00575 [Nanoarchaeota archaeon]
MKPLISKEEQERKDRRNKTIIGVLLVAVMIFSTAGYAFFSSTAGDKNENGGNEAYNGIEFVRGNGVWLFNIGGAEFATQYNPKETEDIKLPILSAAQYNGRPLYIVSEESEASAEVARNMQGFVERMQYACLQNYTCADENLPEKGCEDNVIFFSEANASSIEKEENCVFILHNSSEGVRAADAFLFGILGVR